LNQQLKARIKELSPAIAGASSIAIGIIALTGWALHIELLRSFGLGLIAMNPVTAFVVMLAGGALILLSDPRLIVGEDCGDAFSPESQPLLECRDFSVFGTDADATMSWITGFSAADSRMLPRR
jgi:hypothetical protein